METVRDMVGDKVEVLLSPFDHHVVTYTYEMGQRVEHNYTPAQARKLAKALKRAAKAIESNTNNEEIS